MRVPSATQVGPRVDELRATYGDMGRGARPTTARADPLREARVELRGLLRTLEQRSQLPVRGDGWSAREILAHSADLAEVFCEHIRPGSFPAALTTAVRDAHGRVDLVRTNEALRQLRGSDPLETSAARLEACLELAASVASLRPDDYWVGRLRDHTREHVAELMSAAAASTGSRAERLPLTPRGLP